MWQRVKLRMARAPDGSLPGLRGASIIAIATNSHHHTTTSFLPHTHINMFRTSLVRATRAAVQATTRVQRPAFQRAIQTPFVQSRISTPATSISAIRCYASSSGLGQDEVTGRIMDLLKNFDKVWRLFCKDGYMNGTNFVAQVRDPSKVRSAGIKEATRVDLTEL